MQLLKFGPQERDFKHFVFLIVHTKISPRGIKLLKVTFPEPPRASIGGSNAQSGSSVFVAFVCLSFEGRESHAGDEGDESDDGQESYKGNEELCDQCISSHAWWGKVARRLRGGCSEAARRSIGTEKRVNLKG